MTLRPAIYTRVSTADQSADLQIREAREFCRRRQFTMRDVRVRGTVDLDSWGDPIEFTDTMTGSASSDKRPGLEQLLKAVRARKADVVVVWKLDRLARSLGQLLNLLEEFKALGVQLVSLRDPGLDTTTPAGRAMFGMIGVFAEFERDLIRERAMAGQALAKARGVHIGRKSQFSDATAAALSKRIRDLRAGNKTWSDVSATLELPPSTCRRLAGEL